MSGGPPDPLAGPVDDDPGARPPAPAAGPAAARRRRWPRRVVLAAAVLLVAWIGVGVVALLSAAGSADDGAAAMRRAQQATGSLPALVRSLGATPGDAGAGDPGAGGAPDAAATPLGAADAARELRVAGGDFAAAADTVASPWLAPLRVVPLLGRQLRSVDALATAAADAATSAADALDELVAELQADTGGSGARLDSARRAREVLDGLRAELAGLELGPDEGLVPPVGEARDRFVAERDRLDATLATATDGLGGVISFLQGPSRYLVLAANNAEMRAGSGMFLAGGVLTVADGRFDLGPVVATEPLVRPEPAATPDADLANLWGWLAPERDLRNVNLTPRFAESARLAAALWEDSGGGPVDGVLVLDVDGLRELLRVVGPVEVQGPDGPLTIAAGDVRQVLLREQYQRFTEQAERRDLLGDVARGIFAAFNERPWSAASLVGALERSGSGRNLLLWSPDPVEQAAWEALDAAGSLTPDSLLLSVVNRGGNKLDQFLEARPTLTWGPSPSGDGLRQVRVEVELTNAAPERLPRYIEGPYPGTDLAAGEYLGILTLALPAGAGNAAMEGAELSLSGPDGPVRMVGGQVRLARGASATVVVTFDLPTAWEALTVQPSARVPPVRWVVDGEELPHRRPVVVPLGPTG